MLIEVRIKNKLSSYRLPIQQLRKNWNGTRAKENHQRAPSQFDKINPVFEVGKMIHSIEQWDDAK